MANKAIDDLLKYGSIRFNETFTHTYVPPVANTIYSNFYNNWSIMDYSGTRGGLDGHGFYNLCNADTGSQTSRIYRTVEGYSVGGKYSIFARIYSGMPASVAGTDCIELSLFGNPMRSGLIGNSELTPINFGGIGLSFQTRGLGDNSRVQLLINGSVVQTDASYAARASFYVWMDISNLTISYSFNTTGVKPKYPMHIYTAPSITKLSSAFIIGQAGAVSNNIQHYTSVEELSIFKY